MVKKLLIQPEKFKLTDFCLIFGLIMENVKHIIINLLVIFISFLFIDEGKSILLIGDNIQIHLNHDQNRELEIPHQHNFDRYDDDVKWMNSNSFELSCSSEKLLLFPCYLNKRTEDYEGLIWQPPKSV
jgi:hypothetical protein